MEMVCQLIWLCMVIDDNPNVDAGLIAVDINGNIGAKFRKVGGRTDISSAYLENGDTKVAVFNNEIHPIKITSKLAAAIAMEIMAEEQTGYANYP